MEEKSFIDYMIEDGDHKISIFTKIKWKIEKIGHAYRCVKWSSQRVFRTHHASDCDLWGLSEHLAPIILGKLQAFKNMPRHGYPSFFSDYCKEEWGSKEEYEDAVAKGKVTGGDEEAWNKVLDEMIFAFEFITYYEAKDKKRDRMLKKYGLKYPHEKTPESRTVHYVYKCGKDKDKHIMSSYLPPDDPANAKREYLGEDISYYNFNLEGEYYKRAQKGLELFAKHFMSLWD